MRLKFQDLPIEFNWNAATRTHWHVVQVSFTTTRAELRNDNRVIRPPKPHLCTVRPFRENIGHTWAYGVEKKVSE